MKFMYTSPIVPLATTQNPNFPEDGKHWWVSGSIITQNTLSSVLTSCYTQNIEYW